MTSELTGFSAFELLYGRSIRGPLSVLKDLWEDQDIKEEERTNYQLFKLLTSLYLPLRLFELLTSLYLPLRLFELLTSLYLPLRLFELLTSLHLPL
ncbi:hypothetical protein Pmani_036737 [Petrolisthes manimaculis]|uniref:Uncharacterized protein n=1 Tax=Petrolisthes manimaculis TaxID=1843537 RepID=A0AAE1NHS2_9EUCA|nr:hypothetical protein Pmani_036737 [Petrolisthes manimaculis]